MQMPTQSQSESEHVYFILPIYNEEKGLPPLLETLATVPLPNGRTIVAVNDGSKDGSGEILAEGLKRYPIKLITHSPNRGIPGVYKSAFEYVMTVVQDDDVVILMESDGTSDPSLIPSLVKAIEAGNDIAIGSRHVPGGAYLAFPWYRKMASALVNVCLAMTWRLPGIKDYTIFYRAYRGSILKKGFANGVSFKAVKSFAANGEILLILAPHHPKVAELPLRYNYGLKGSVSSMPLMATLMEYVRLAGQYPRNN
jgi:dolichol-phosphate mannosyltransferase